MTRPTRRPFARWIATALLAAALIACGGKDKKKDTLPGGGAGTGVGGQDATGMGDGGDPGDLPPGGGGGGGGDGTGGTGGDGTGGDGTGGTGGTGGDGTGGTGDGTADGGGAVEAPPPKVVPPNLDPDPDEARTKVQGHVRAGRDALKGDSPDPDLAIREAKAALAIDGTSVDAVVVLAHAYYHKRLYDTAETVLDMLIKERDAAQRNPGVYYVFGLVYDKTGEPAKAFKAYQTAVQLKPDYGSALINLGVHQLRNKQYDEAISTYEKLTGDLGYNDARTWNSLGSAYRGKSADFDPGSDRQADWLLRAETAYKRATAADRNYGLPYYNLGLLYLDANPFPDGGGGSMDTLVRLQKAKTYFEEYKNLPGVDMKLFDERMKNVDKLIKREEKKRKAKAREAAESN